jgi:S-disulfanyl-L-cysteine oxidoreductase SoxD
MPQLCRLAMALTCAGLLAGIGASTFSRAAAAGQVGPVVKSTRDGAYTRAQATRGQRIYGEKCAACHPLEAFTDPVFLAAWNGQTAYALFTSIRTTMPQENPGGLRRQDYADLVAYLLHLNKLPAGSAELGASEDALKQVVIEPPAKKE